MGLTDAPSVVVVTHLMATATLPTVFLSAALALAITPVLAGWSATLPAGQVVTSKRPVEVSRGRLAMVALVAIAFGALAGGGRPWPAWWLLAVGGTVLAVVDAQRNLLPARFVYSLSLVEAVALLFASVADDDPAPLIRAAAAVLIIGACWLIFAFAAGGGLGLGDVRLAALTAGLLGWLGWTAVMRAQVLAVVLIAASAVVVAVAIPELRGRKMPIPLGPALILSSLIICWT
ncbi:MAG: peptidase prepilin type [Pseudonocardiales bacterium]|nr:peptidase prepilin type [Pseudonocardiales bacterium]